MGKRQAMAAGKLYVKRKSYNEMLSFEMTFFEMNEL